MREALTRRHPGLDILVSEPANAQTTLRANLAVACVEVSTDGGELWEDTEVVGPDLGPYAPMKFRYVWDLEPGEHTLRSHATDEAGRTQSATISEREQELRGIENDQYPWNKKGYGNNAYVPHTITVEVTE